MLGVKGLLDFAYIRLNSRGGKIEEWSLIVKKCRKLLPIFEILFIFATLKNELIKTTQNDNVLSKYGHFHVLHGNDDDAPPGLG